MKNTPCQLHLALFFEEIPQHVVLGHCVLHRPMTPALKLYHSGVIGTYHTNLMMGCFKAEK